ncbi:MBL fold metallo-hydrolase [bacterium]|nr:MBL fold metallo-hydrolase [bacterium]
MKLTIVYNNEAKEGFRSGWGFSCLIEGDRIPTILFDTGADGRILMSNMEKLQINPSDIEVVFISHHHYDHTGGLSAFLDANSNVKLYAPASFRGVRHAREVIHISQPIKIHENIFSTGELDGIEQSLAVKTVEGIVLITGCSHPKMNQIIDTISEFGKVVAVVGGFHGFNEFELFKDMDLICPTHCTQNIKKIRSLYPNKTIEGGSGRTILFEKTAL